MGALKNLKSGIPPKARLMLAISAGVLLVGTLGIINMMSRDDEGPVENSGLVDVDVPSERDLPKSEVGETPTYQEGSEMARIIEEQRRKSMQEALQSKEVSLTDPIRIPQAEARSTRGDPGMEVEGLRDVIEERREKERRAREAARAAAAQSGEPVPAGAVQAPPMFDRTALLADEIARARGKIDPLEQAMDRLSLDHKTVRTQGEATENRGKANSTASVATHNAAPAVGTNASSYANGFIRQAAATKAAPNTVAERLGRYRQAMGAASGNPTAQLDEGMALQNLGAGAVGNQVGLASGQVATAIVNTNPDGTPTRMIPAGKILYAVLDTAVDSDSTQYVRATIVQEGPFKGATALGQVQLRGERVVLSFNRLGHKGKDHAVQAVAVDPDSNQTALADSVDRHIIERYGLLWGAAFMEGFADAMSNSTTVINSDGSTTSTRERLPETSDQILVATGKVGERTVPMLSSKFNRPVTVHVASDRPIGLMLLQGLPY